MINMPAQVDMGLLVKGVLAQLAGPLKKKKVIVTVQSNLPRFYCDQQRISQVLQNLVENAIKYMGDQTSPCIEIGVRKKDKQYVFFVRDNGAGVEPLYQEKIFDLFNKIDAESNGSGIGLALVKRIIEVHGGRVWVESEGVGRGSNFYFALPG
jgi:signal transduction histidine kinase